MLAIAGITAAIGFLLSPVGLLVAGVAAVAAGFVLWQQNFGNVQGRAAALAGMLKDMAENATGIDFDAIGDGLRSFGNYIGAVIEDGDYLNDWLTHLPESIQPAAEAFGRFVAALGALWNTGDIGTFVQELRDMFPEAAAAVDGAVGGVTKAIGEISDAITAFRDGNLDVPELIWNIANALIGDGANYYVIRDAVNAIGAAWQSVQGAALAMWTWLQVAIPAAVEAMRSAWTTAWPAIQEAFSAAWGTVSGGLAAAWAWLQVALPAALGWLQSTWTAVWPAMQSAWDTLWGVLQPAWTTAQTWMQTTLPAALTGLQTAWAAAWPALQTAWDTTWAALSAAWTLAKAWLDTTLPGALTALQTAWEQTWPALQTASSTAWEGIKGTLDNLKAAFTGMQTGASQVSGTLAGFWAQVSTIGAMLAAFFAPAMERLQAAFSKLPESLAPLMPKLQALGEAFGGLFQALQPFVLLVGAALAIAVDFGVNRLTTVFETLPGILGPVIDQITATIKLITVILTETVTAVKAVIDGDWTTVWESAKTIAGGFSTFFRGLFSRLGTFMMAVAVNMTQPVIDTLRDLGVDVDPILNGIKKTFETIWGGIQSAIQAVIDIVGTLTDTFSGFKSFLDGLSLNNPFAPLVDAYNTIAGGITKIGTPGGMDNDPNTPWRGGTSYYPGGIGMMNEVAGLSETVILPAGSRIMTAAQSQNQQGAGGQPPQITVNMGGVTIANDMDVQRIGWGLANQIAAALG
jgi:phage-related protein